MPELSRHLISTCTAPVCHPSRNAGPGCAFQSGRFRHQLDASASPQLGVTVTAAPTAGRPPNPRPGDPGGRSFIRRDWATGNANEARENCRTPTFVMIIRGRPPHVCDGNVQLSIAINVGNGDPQLGCPPRSRSRDVYIAVAGANEKRISLVSRISSPGMNRCHRRDPPRRPSLTIATSRTRASDQPGLLRNQPLERLPPLRHY